MPKKADPEVQKALEELTADEDQAMEPTGSLPPVNYQYHRTMGAIGGKAKKTEVFESPVPGKANKTVKIGRVTY